MSLQVRPARSNRTDGVTIAMKPQPKPSAQEVLAGLVERVTYHNAENGFCVLRAKARGHRDVVTVVGYSATIAAGEWITASGEWVNDRTHGQQFKARFLRTSLPDSADGIEKYLSSGMIRGVGPGYAKKLVRAFGDKVFDVGFALQILQRRLASSPAAIHRSLERRRKRPEERLREERLMRQGGPAPLTRSPDLPTYDPDDIEKSRALKPRRPKSKSSSRLLPRRPSPNSKRRSRTAFCSAQAARMLVARTGPMPSTSRSRSGPPR